MTNAAATMASASVLRGTAVSFSRPLVVQVDYVMLARQLLQQRGVLVRKRPLEQVIIGRAHVEAELC
jgi:hypothetical protein